MKLPRPANASACSFIRGQAEDEVVQILDVSENHGRLAGSRTLLGGHGGHDARWNEPLATRPLAHERDKCLGFTSFPEYSRIHCLIAADSHMPHAGVEHWFGRLRTQMASAQLTAQSYWECAAREAVRGVSKAREGPGKVARESNMPPPKALTSHERLG